MFAAYERMKMTIVLTIAAIILLLIARKELDWATTYVETTATISGIEQTCAGGRLNPGRYIDCDKALPTASRRTLLELTYVSPADGRRHRATVRCDTSVEDTPRYRLGEPLDVLAHESEPGRLDRRRCTAMPAPASRT